MKKKLTGMTLFQFLCIAEVGKPENRKHIRFGVISESMDTAKKDVEVMFKTDKFLKQYNCIIEQLSLNSEEVVKNDKLEKNEVQEQENI